MYVDNKGEQEGKQVSMFYYHCEALINNSILHFFLCEPISPERYFFLISSLFFIQVDSVDVGMPKSKAICFLVISPLSTVTIASYLTSYDLASNLRFMPFPVTAEPVIPPVFRLDPSLVRSAFLCPAIPPRHSERHVRSKKKSPFITTVN